MMKAYLGFDDTDSQDSLYGTGKLVRWFQQALPDGCRCLGIVRQQLFISDQIPYTSHNSSACLIAEIPEAGLLNHVIEKAAAHIDRYAVQGSDPGLCALTESDASLDRLVDFGYRCTREVTTQKQALEAVAQGHLSGHGGTNDGIIGAAAAVGLTLSGWCGRFIEFGNLRDMPEKISVADASKMGIEVVSADRDANVPAAHDTIITRRWLRPRLLGHRPVLFVNPVETGVWRNIYGKRERQESRLQDLNA